MSRREFHFISGGSSKFWAIELKGESFDVTYGKIGTSGTTQTKSFADAATAQKAYDKLVQEKTSKGYVEIGAAPAKGAAKAGTAAGKAAAGLNEMYFATTQNISDMQSLSTFIGHKVAKFKSPKSLKKGDGYVYRIGVSYEDEDEDGNAPDFDELLEGFLACPAAATARGLVIGNWALEGMTPVQPIIKKLVAGKDRMPELAALFLGDICQEECEISWIVQCDLTPVLNAFPKLEMLRVRGSDKLSFKDASHKTLRALAIESGGLPRDVVGQICKAKLPNLEYLELWLGTEDYGGNTRVNDLQPILKGTAFPKLKYLGLRNSEIVDEIAGVIINSPIVKQIETLDLSLGTLTDEGGRALLKLPQDGKLKRLDLHRHFLSKPMMKQLKELPFTVNVANQEQPDDWGDGEMRFVAIGE